MGESSRCQDRRADEYRAQPNSVQLRLHQTVRARQSVSDTAAVSDPLAPGVRRMRGGAGNVQLNSAYGFPSAGKVRRIVQIERVGVPEGKTKMR